MMVVLPFVPLVLFISSARTPADVQAQSTSLLGPWKIIESDEPGLGAPEVDDSSWKTIDLPGSFALRGFPSQHHWVRRTVDLGDVSESQFLLLGNIRNGIADLYVNGEYLGRNESTMPDYQADWTTSQGWEIPPRFLKPGHNLLAMRIFWHEIETDGLYDRRLLIGPEHIVRPAYARAKLSSALFTLGSLLMSVLLFALLLALRLAAREESARRRFVSAMALVGSVAFYNSCVTGIITLLYPVPSTWMAPIAAASMALVASGVWAFTESELLGRVTWAQKANWVIMPLFVVGALFNSAALRIESLYLALFLIYMAVLAVRAMLRRPTPTIVLIGSSLLVVVTTAFTDVLSNVGFLDLPDVFSQALTNLAVAASVALIVEFINISRKNQLLSASLAMTNSDLSSALARAQESTRIKSELLASVSHELRTPLNSIINIPDGLLEDFPEDAKGTSYVGEPADTARYIKRIAASGRHLLSVVNDILDHSRLNAGRLPLSLSELSLTALFTELRDTVEPLAEQKRINVILPSNPPDVPLQADAVRLKQVLLNLIGNAIKFSNEGGRITVTVERAGASYVFAVRDEGIGIAPENQKLIFESFRQVDGGTTRRFGGTGLGLAIARDLVTMHGGAIWVESQVGHGSTFSFRVPLAGPAVAPTGTPRPKGRPLESRTILIVDDDSTTLETIKLALRPLDFVLVGTTDARGALGMVKEFRPDLVVLDVMMPHLSGIELLERLRGDEALKATRVLVTSAYPENEPRSRSLGATWVAKPWGHEELSRAALDALERTTTA